MQIEVSFRAIEQQKFSSVIRAVAEDLENLNLVSPDVEIPI